MAKQSTTTVAPSLDQVRTPADLEASIGSMPPTMTLKVIDHLDAIDLRWIAASRVFFAGFGNDTGIDMTLGSVDGITAEAATLRLPASSLDDPTLAKPGAGFGSLFLVPGIRETLRVNGKVTDVQGGDIHIDVRECYAHCAKALIRSDFWAASPIEWAPQDLAEFLAHSRFMALASMNDNGEADVSPKGDPAGDLARLIDGEFCYAERPGNRRADSLRNVLRQPRVTVTLLVPGTSYIARVSGTARISANEPLRAAFAVNGKTPTLVTRMGELGVELRQSAALRRAALWPVRSAALEIKPADMFLAHVKLNRHKGIETEAVDAVLSTPGLMQQGLDQDYKTNLY